jgi:hypothetical protein
MAILALTLFIVYFALGFVLRTILQRPRFGWPRRRRCGSGCR